MDEDAFDDSDGLEDPTYVKYFRLKLGVTKQYCETPDLKVVLQNGSRTHIFLVLSHALTIASKVWKRIISPGSFKLLDKEPYGRDGEYIKIMNLEDDDPPALDIIFKIIHLQTDKIPFWSSFKLLRNLAIVCDKYECGKVLKPWSHLWMKTYTDKATSARYEDWLFIAKALDPKNMRTTEISRALTLESSSKSECGTYLVRSCGRYHEDWTVTLELIPDKIISIATTTALLR
ncbi:hypothetical protein ABW20_dc0108814 [Dactylellina cionopaga]|nr:hypothetical protein ABW20_dc0108814 [Dactylellina cionopaga]